MLGPRLRPRAKSLCSVSGPAGNTLSPCTVTSQAQYSAGHSAWPGIPVGLAKPRCLGGFTPDCRHGRVSRPVLRSCQSWQEAPVDRLPGAQCITVHQCIALSQLMYSIRCAHSSQLFNHKFAVAVHESLQYLINQHEAQIPVKACLAAAAAPPPRLSGQGHPCPCPTGSKPLLQSLPSRHGTQCAHLRSLTT